MYGGASVGLMGILADTVLSKGGKVIGVIPEALKAKEIAHNRLTDLRIVGLMHERKQTMYDLSDGFIVLPGGLGTLDEFFEIVTWAQLGLHIKPSGILNAKNFFEHLLKYLDHAVSEKLMRKEHREIISVEDTPSALLEKFNSYQPPQVKKWIDRDET